MAIAALGVGVLIINRLSVRDARIARLRIGELDVDRLRVRRVERR